MRSFLASLNEHPMALLRGIAELRGVELDSNHREDAAAQLAAALATPEATVGALAACSAAGQAAWHSLRAAGGRMKAAVFARSNGEIRPIGPGRLEREATWQHPATPAEELWYRGLIFRAFADLGEGPLEYIYIPEDLPLPADDARPAPEDAAAPPLQPAPAPAAPQYDRNALAVDLCALLAELRETPGQLDKAGRLRPGETERLGAGLLVTDAARCEMLLALARGRGWLAADRDRLVLVAQGTTAWLRGAPWQQMSSLFAAWRDSVDWDDLRHVPGLRAEGEWRSDPRLARRGILTILRRLPAGWYAVADLVSHIKTANPDFQRPDGDYTRWYLKDIESDRYLSGFETWDEVEGRLIRFIVTGPLRWLGAVALGQDAEAGAIFRLTPYGAAWLTGTTPAELPRPERLSVGEDFVVTAPLRCPLLDRFRLLRFTEPVPLPDGEPAPPAATRHRISRGSLARARAAGLKADAIAQFLQRAAGGRAPARVLAALSRFDRVGGAVRVSRGAVVRVADASVLAALRADSAIAPLLGDLLSAQAVLVDEANLDALLTALRETGYTVKEG